MTVVRAFVAPAASLLPDPPARPAARSPPPRGRSARRPLQGALKPGRVERWADHQPHPPPSLPPLPALYPPRLGTPATAAAAAAARRVRRAPLPLLYGRPLAGGEHAQRISTSWADGRDAGGVRAAAAGAACVLILGIETAATRQRRAEAGRCGWRAATRTRVASEAAGVAAAGGRLGYLAHSTRATSRGADTQPPARAVRCPASAPLCASPPGGHAGGAVPPRMAARRAVASGESVEDGGRRCPRRREWRPQRAATVPTCGRHSRHTPPARCRPAAFPRRGVWSNTRAQGGQRRLYRTAGCGLANTRLVFHNTRLAFRGGCGRSGGGGCSGGSGMSSRGSGRAEWRGRRNNEHKSTTGPCRVRSGSPGWGWAAQPRRSIQKRRGPRVTGSRVGPAPGGLTQ